MLLYGYVAQWKKRVVDWVAALSIIGALVAFIGVIGDSYVRLSAFFIFGMIALVAGALMLSPDSMETVLPVPDEFYKPLGVFDATVRNVAPHVVEVETDSGAVLFVDAWRLTRLLSPRLPVRGTCALMAWVVSWTLASVSVRLDMARMLLWATSRAASGAVRRVFTRSRPFAPPTDNKTYQRKVNDYGNSSMGGCSQLPCRVAHNASIACSGWRCVIRVLPVAR